MSRASDRPVIDWQMKKAGSPKIVTEDIADPTRSTSSPRIRCPKCKWATW